jgi:hypothetical protein
MHVTTLLLIWAGLSIVFALGWTARGMFDNGEEND